MLDAEHSLTPQPRPSTPGSERWWNLLNREAVVEILAAAVRDGLAEVEAGALAKDVLPQTIARTFLAEARQRARRVRGTTKRGFLLQLQRSRNSTLLQRDAALEELTDLQKKTAELRTSLENKAQLLGRVEEQTLDEELARELERLNRRALLSSGGGLEPASIEQLRKFVRKQRREALTLALSGYRERMGLLERRVSKLNSALTSTEQALQVLATKAQIDPGIASIFRTVQGISAGTPHQDVKREMLRVIFEANLEMQNTRNVGS